MYECSGRIKKKKTPLNANSIAMKHLVAVSRIKCVVEVNFTFQISHIACEGAAVVVAAAARIGRFYNGQVFNIYEKKKREKITHLKKIPVFSCVRRRRQ